MSKKIIGVIIAATLAVSLVACGEKKKIVIIQLII